MIVNLKWSMLQAYNTLLWSIKKEFLVSWFSLSFLRGQVSLQLNALFICDSVPSMLEEIDKQSNIMMFPIDFLLWNKDSGYTEDAELAKLSSLFSEPVVEIYMKSTECSKKIKGIDVFIAKPHEGLRNE